MKSKTWASNDVTVIDWNDFVQVTSCNKSAKMARDWQRLQGCNLTFEAILRVQSYPCSGLPLSHLSVDQELLRLGDALACEPRYQIFQI